MAISDQSFIELIQRAESQGSSAAGTKLLETVVEAMEYSKANNMTLDLEPVLVEYLAKCLMRWHDEDCANSAARKAFCIAAPKGGSTPKFNHVKALASYYTYLVSGKNKTLKERKKYALENTAALYEITEAAVRTLEKTSDERVWIPVMSILSQDTREKLKALNLNKKAQ